MPAPRKIILDCDPGHDDAIALLVAYGSPAIDLVAVTTVCGNQTVDLVTRNALVIGTVAGMTDVLFARGAEHPLRRDHLAAESIHGASGMDGPAPREPQLPLDPRPADQLIVDLIMAAEPGEITLVATAPLTNVALALQREPAIAGRVAEVAIMGGAVGQGKAERGDPPLGVSARSQRGVVETKGRRHQARAPELCAGPPAARAAG